MEIGIDTENVERFKSVSESFIKRVYASEEIEYAENQFLKAEHLAGFWCIKEAVIKATGENFYFKDICTLHNENGKPFLKKTPAILKYLEKSGHNEIKISISHSKTQAVAICLVV